jgi:hypothetical protein
MERVPPRGGKLSGCPNRIFEAVKAVVAETGVLAKKTRRALAAFGGPRHEEATANRRHSPGTPLSS